MNKKVKQVQKNLTRFFRDKKNKKIIFLVIGAVLLYLVYAKFKGGSTTTTTSTTREAEPETENKGAWANPYPTIPGTVTPKLHIYSYPEHLDLRPSGSSGNWTFVDVSNTVLEDNKEYWYFINGSAEVIKTRNKLTFNWPSDDPLTIEKMQILIGTENLYYLGNDNTNNNLIQSFSMNTSVAFQSFIFNTL